jgi:uncharacterized protein (DUF1697 family)
MAVYVALLRAINVGGTGKLAMSELREMCAEAGFEEVVTYIQSGNVVFSSRRGKAEVQRLLGRALEAKMGKPVGVLVRTPAELAAILDRNPFPDAPGNRVLVLFLDRTPSADALAGLRIPGREEVEVAGS